MGLAEELRAAAEQAARFATDGETVVGVLPAETDPGARVYLCAFHSTDGHRTWLALDGAGQEVSDRVTLRDAVSMVALCELAAETAAGGDVDELISQLVAIRLTEAPDGIEDAEEAARELQRAIGAPPQLATPARLDEIGQATRRLEQALDPTAGSPFGEAMKAATGAVEELTREVEGTYRRELS